MTHRLTLVLGLSFLVGLQAFAQEKGFVRGNIVDGDFGGPMIGANITVAELPGVGTTTDFDGNYSLPLAPGTYTIQVSFISYTTQQFSDVSVAPGKVAMIDAVMTSAAEELAVVEVTAEVRRTSEVAMLMDMKNATNVTDGLSSQSFRKIGDSDLSGAIKRVTGVTVQNGKYVYVRGLGDRYTKTTLNGMALPGMDPDANAVQIDIFPTSVLENVAVSKTFSPDLDGDFSGGLVNVVTKNFPDEKSTSVGVGMTFIPDMHFNKSYILYDRASTSFTGYDFGNRDLHFDPLSRKYENIPNPVLNDPLQEDVTRGFDPQLAAKNKMALPNGSFSLAHGNQINREGGTTFGYNAVFNYSNETVLYQRFVSDDYLRNIDLDDTELFRQVAREGTVGKNNVLWSGLLAGAIKRDNSMISATFLNSQGSESTASQRTNQDFNQNQAKLVEDVLTYTQRSLSSFILAGEHRMGLVEVNWSNALSYSRVYDPDFRETRISVTDGDTTLTTGNGAGIDRFWRELNEYNETFKADVKIKFNESGFVKVGGLGTYKARDFETYSYKHRRGNLSDISIDPDWFLEEDNVWVGEYATTPNPSGTYTIGSYQASNSFEASQIIYAGYGMMNHSLLGFMKVVYGARVEGTQMYYTGQNNSGTVAYNDTMTMNNLNVLPSANVVIKVTEDMNIRLGANRTLARPSFKEKSIAQIYDPITKRTFIGNINLEQTNINNFDLRYEFFMSPKELFSIGAFYKQFDGHIELVSFPTAPDNLSPRNSGQAESFGVEVEMRKGLPNAQSGLLQKLFLSTNVSLVESRVDMNSVIVNNEGMTEMELRENYARTGQTIEQYRPMAGQSPYAVNVAFSWEDAETQSSISLAYNVQGEQLSIIASGRVPDIYTLPFHSLNLNAQKSFGKSFQHRLTFGLNNILNEDVSLVYRAHEADKGDFSLVKNFSGERYDGPIYSSYRPGVGISLKYNYTF